MSEESQVCFFYRNTQENIYFKTFPTYAYLNIFCFMLTLLGCLEVAYLSSADFNAYVSKFFVVVVVNAHLRTFFH